MGEAACVAAGQRNWARQKTAAVNQEASFGIMNGPPHAGETGLTDSQPTAEGRSPLRLPGG